MNRIKMVRKSIARVLTVKVAKRRGEVFKEVAKHKRKPLDARKNRLRPPPCPYRRRDGANCARDVFASNRPWHG